MIHKHEEKSLFKAFLYGMGCGAFLMFILLLPVKAHASDANKIFTAWHKTFILKLVINHEQVR